MLKKCSKDFIIWFKHKFKLRLKFSLMIMEESFLTLCWKSFVEKRAIHQSSCSNIPQQNGVAKQKNKTLIEVTRVRSFQIKVPKFLWGEAVLTATYLSNRVPIKTLTFQTPLQFSHIPTMWLLLDVLLKIFRSVVFADNHDPKLSKLDSKTRKCIL